MNDEINKDIKNYSARGKPPNDNVQIVPLMVRVDDEITQNQHIRGQPPNDDNSRIPLMVRVDEENNSDSNLQYSISGNSSGSYLGGNSNDTSRASPINLPLGFENNPRKMFLYGISRRLSGLVKISNNAYYYYNGKYYEILYDNIFNTKLCLYLKEQGMEVLESDIRFLSGLLKCNAYIEITPNPLELIQYNNCFVNSLQNMSYSHDKQIFTTGCINANYVNKAQYYHPNFDKYISDVANGDKCLELRIWQFLGYVLTPDYNAKRIFILYGVGDSGKSLLIRIISELLTPSLVCNLSIKNLVTGRFALSELMGKRVSLASDEGNFQIKPDHTACLKRLSGGGDTITVDVKNRQQVSFISTAKIIIASNSPIHATAAAIDPAFKNRLMVIPFNHAIPKEQQDYNLFEKIMSERDDIVSHAYQYYLALRSNNYIFAGDNGIYDDVTAFVPGMMPYDALQEFCSSNCVFDNESFTSTDCLYNAFRNTFPENNPYRDSTAFSQTFYNLNKEKVVKERKRTPNGNLRGYIGVRLNHNTSNN